MDWTVLGIEPTKDKKAITAAYRQKLRQTNPEDKPEEFKALRAAYEEALALADQQETAPARDESPVGLWTGELEKLYEDFAARLDPARWQALLNSQVCTGLDTRPAAEAALLNFLMAHYYLPKDVWQVLDGTFSFSQRVEELYEAWPRDFIDHAVLSGIRLDPAIDFSLFTPGVSGTACDTYCKLYFQSNHMPLNEIGSILEQMDALSEGHPYGEALRCRFLMETGREQEGREGLGRLAREYPDNATLALAWANLCLDAGNTEEAERTAAHILTLQPEHIGAKSVLVKCLAARGEYHEAKEYGYDILRAGNEHPALVEELSQLMKQWNGELILRREARRGEDPGDTDNLIELAWCYLQNDRDEDALTAARQVDPAHADAFGYHNLMGKLLHKTGDHAQALEHLREAELALRGLRDDGTRETRKRMARIPEILQYQGNCLSKLGRNDEAREKYELALEEAPEDTQMLSLLGQILYSSGDYEYAVDIFRRLLRLSPYSLLAAILMALSLYRLRRDREAFDAANRAMSIQSNDLSIYTLKMQILLRNQAFDQVREILDFLEQSGAPEDIAVDLVRAQLLELEKKDTKSALKQYRSLAKRVEEGEGLFWVPELYYHLAVLTGNQMDLREKKNNGAVLEIIDKGLAAYAQDPDLLSYKAWVLKKGGDREAAVEMYRELEKKDPNSPVALRGLADLYYEDLSRYAEEALCCYEKLLQTQKTPELYFFAATCKRHLGDLEGARTYYLKELEMDPEDIDAYRGLALISEVPGEYEKSLELVEQACSIMDEYHNYYDWMLEHKAKVLRRLGRAQEALAYAREIGERYHYGDSMQLQFDICCQFGLWDQARAVLEQWKKEGPSEPDRMAAEARLNLLLGRMFRATLAMGPAKHKLPAGQIQDFRMQLADLECNHSRKVQLLTSSVNQDPTDDLSLLRLAHAYCLMGKTDVARGAAGKALAILDKTLKLHLTDEALYRSRRCLALAILGRAGEAREELARVRRLPLCHFCEYGRCKDADIYEAEIEELLGNTDRAKELYARGRANWPDELDFTAGEARLKKKKGRK